MFNLAQLAGLLANPGKIQAQFQEMTDRVAQLTAEGSAGGGLVTATVNGRMEILRIRISDEALTDREMLEDLTASALNQALTRIRALVAEETQKTAAALGVPLPPGLGLPGMP